MNFCCHDDYTGVGVFSADHKNIYIAWQAWLGTFETQSEFTTLTDFQAYFDTLVSQGQVNALINPIANLPVHPSTDLDCADFTEQGSIAADDKNIFIAFQAWLGTFEVGESLGTLSEFQTYFDTLVSQGQVNALVNPVKHLPTLEADTQVITDEGLVDKCGPSCTETCSVSVENDVLKVAFDATTLSNEHDGSVRGVEIVFENIVFEDGGLSITPGEKQTLVDGAFKTTENTSSLNFYYDYAIRTDGSDANKTKSVIGFIDVTQNGTGETKQNLGAMTIEVQGDNWEYKPDETEPAIADVRVYDSHADVRQYGIETCEG